MHRSVRLDRSSRSVVIDRTPAQVRAVVAASGPGPHWYVDAAPFVVRGVLDRLVGGHGRRWATPDRALLEAGDRAGFWLVTRCDDSGLALRADVRAPGEVDLDVGWREVGPGRTGLSFGIRFTPRRLMGRIYQVIDLPAREVVIELTFAHLLAALMDRAGGPTV